MNTEHILVVTLSNDFLPVGWPLTYQVRYCCIFCIIVTLSACATAGESADNGETLQMFCRGYWHQAATSCIPRNCLMELVRTAYGDKRLDKEGDLQKTVMKMTLRTSDTEVSEMYPDDAEAGVKLSMETVDWINWKQVFRSWMVANNYLDKFAPEVTELDTDGVTCVGISGGYIVTGHVSGARCVWDMVTCDSVTLPTCHEDQVTCLALVDVLHQGPYHGGLQHHVLVSGGGHLDSSLVVSVLPDQFSGQLDKTQEVRLRRHNYGVVTISVLDSSMAVMGGDNTVSMWVMNTPRNENELPSLECYSILPGPVESHLVTGLSDVN